ncbi:EVE domain-containing protein [Aliikangiella sp. G2MR2-5]|uniref:EVE domain-containing protein n=1 Tax=Aliikangiella sp. G2MR2-5 TaxID=2788943 RepID=UPI0018A889CB|nr:EVE domain-containing protein [Aliikangiella sp. G2MR2-5]
MNYWLLKTEPEEFSIDDLQNKAGAEIWEGIRNYQARNIIRDQIELNDRVLIYHSSCKNVGVAGVGEISKAGYPCPYQFEKSHKYFDPKAESGSPRWYVMDVKFVEKFSSLVSLKQIKQESILKDMVLVKQGRLSVQPVTKDEFEKICSLGRSD